MARLSAAWLLSASLPPLAGAAHTTDWAGRGADVWNVSTSTFSLSFCESAVGRVTVCADSYGAFASSGASSPESALPTCTGGSWEFVGTSSAPPLRFFNYSCAAQSIDAVSWWLGDPDVAGPIRRGLTLRNHGAQPWALSPGPTLSLNASVPADSTPLAHWHIQKEAGGTAPHGPLAASVTSGYSKALTSGSYSSDAQDDSRDDVMWLCLQGAKTKRVQGVYTIYGGVEFSGWSSTSVSRPDAAVGATIHMGIKPGSSAVVAPGEEFVYPTVFIGATHGDVEDSTNELHRWVEAKLRPPVPGGLTPLIVHNSWWIGMEVDKAKVQAMADVAIEAGMEMIHVDAGWFRAVGDWRPNPEKFPGNALRELSDYVHAHGMRFGLWVGWVQGGDRTAVGDATEPALSVFNSTQNGWFPQIPQPATGNTKFGEKYHNPGPFTGATMCLGSVDAQEWAVARLRQVILDFDLDMLEHDQPIITHSGCDREGHHHVVNDTTDSSRAAAQGYYRVYDTVRNWSAVAHRPMFFEDCVNGGRVIDYGIVQRTHYYSVSDNYDSLTCRKAFYDASYPFPPSMLELYLQDSDHLRGYKGGFVYMLRSALLGWPTIMFNSSSWNPDELSSAKVEFANYKAKLRPLIAGANLYHVLPRPTGTTWDGVQYHDPATGTAHIHTHSSILH